MPLTLHIEKPAAGGRMIARHDGAIVLVSGCIPGETVEAEVEKVQRRTIWARTVQVIEPSADRVGAGDGTCGGNVFGHIRYGRQLAIKADILRDGFTRIGRLATPDDLVVVASPADGYRMRARLHARRGRIGFFREGTHDLCDPRPTGQLLAATVDALEALAAALPPAARAETAEVELSENVPATERAIHVELPPGVDPQKLGVVPSVNGVSGLSWGTAHLSAIAAGTLHVTDTLDLPAPAGPITITLTRHVRSFFQGNRFLLGDLIARVVEAVPPGDVVDLYAGVGLFAVALAARGTGRVTAIEGDRQTAQDLRANAGPSGDAIAVHDTSVESFFRSPSGLRPAAVVVDPPRTGVSRDALGGLTTLRAPRVVYVSCDVATLARDARLLIDAGYRLSSVGAYDLFPNTAHVEAVAVFDRHD